MDQFIPHLHRRLTPVGHDGATFQEELLARDRWPRDRILELQRRRLRSIVRHAVTHSPYYRDVIGNKVDEDFTIGDLPVLTKQDLMANFDGIVTDPRLCLADAERHIASDRAHELLFGQYRVVASGGTSGVQGIAVYDDGAWETAVAALRRAIVIQGISPHTRVIGIGSPSPLHLTRWLFSELRRGQPGSPTLSVTTPIPEVVSVLNAFRPDAIITYPSFIRRLVEEQRRDRLRIAPAKFCSTAETLTPDVREMARSTWGANVLNVYGATEVNLIGTECPWTSGLHVPEDLVCVEVVDENYRPVPAGQLGRKVLVTTLFNHVQPLIRYELPDLVSVAEGSCPCGRTHLRLATIQGRCEDFLHLPAREGGCIHVHAVHLHSLLMRIPAIREFELAPCNGTLLIRVVLREKSASVGLLQPVSKAIQTELDRLGARTQVSVQAVHEIPRSGNGAKQKLVRASA